MQTKLILRFLLTLFIGFFTLFNTYSVCAQQNRPQQNRPVQNRQNPQANPPFVDHFEQFNRSAFKVNQKIDQFLFRPVATIYSNVAPPFVQTGVTNFFSNLEDPAAMVNDLLQANFSHAFDDFARFFFNSTFGLGGLIDVASRMGIPKREQDFGLTLAKWGVRNPPFLMIPVIGPTTTRDIWIYPTDYYAFSIWPYLRSNLLRNSLYALWVVEYRASLLPANKLVDQAFDPYVFVRDAYLQRREYLIRTYVDNEKTNAQVTAEADEDEDIADGLL